jgi:hypothetical protein
VRWLADECVDAGLVRRLRSTGHDVAYVLEFGSGMADAEILRRALTNTECSSLRTKISASSRSAAMCPCLGLVLLRADPEGKSAEPP